VLLGGFIRLSVGLTFVSCLVVVFLSVDIVRGAFLSLFPLLSDSPFCFFSFFSDSAFTLSSFGGFDASYSNYFITKELCTFI
jgi:hypothetical protein